MLERNKCMIAGGGWWYFPVAHPCERSQQYQSMSILNFIAGNKNEIVIIEWGGKIITKWIIYICYVHTYVLHLYFLFFVFFHRTIAKNSFSESNRIKDK